MLAVGAMEAVEAVEAMEAMEAVEAIARWRRLECLCAKFQAALQLAFPRDLTLKCECDFNFFYTDSETVLFFSKNLISRDALIKFGTKKRFTQV